MKTSLYFIVTVLLVVACTPKASEITRITGSVEGGNENQVTVYVLDYNIKNEQIEVTDGMFSYELATNPAVVATFTCNMDGKRVSQVLIPDGSELQLVFSSDGASLTSSNKKSINYRYQEVDKVYKEMGDFTSKYVALQRGGAPKEQIDSMAELRRPIFEKLKTLYREDVEKQKNNYLSVRGLMGLQGELTDEQMDSLIHTLDSTVIQTTRIQKVLKDIHGRLRSKEGMPFVDFSIDAEGGTVKLSDFVGNGKYVLADFWASWCKPCIVGMPHLKELYKKYNGSEFTILGIAVFDNPPDIIRYDYPTGYKSTVLSVNLIIISSAGLKITTLEPDVIPAGEKYRFRFQASGLRPITCTVKGKLMKNLAFSDNGLLSGVAGVAPKAGKSTMTFQASNAYSSEAKAFTITALIPPAITTSSLKEGTIGKTYSLNLGRKGGKPLTWFMDGKLPDGVAFDAVKGAIKGTPAKKGIYRLRFTLSNPAGDIEKSLILQVKAIAPKIKGTLKKGTEGKEYKSVFTVTGTKPITMTYSGTLPKGLSFDASTYTFYGTPEEVCKDREIIVTASNIESSTTVKYPLTISGVAPKFVTASLPAGTAGLEYSSDVVITGTAPITVTADGLPDGVTVNPNTGYISGTPQKLGIYNVKLTATNSIKSVNKTLKMTITAPPIFEDETLKNAIAGVAYSHKFTINSLETVKQLSITSGVLPKGISSTASFLPANLLKQGRLISLC